MATRAASRECFACETRLCRFTDTRGGERGRRFFTLARGERVDSCAGDRVKFWTVLSGTAAIYTTLSDGRRQITGVERAGSTISGPMAAEDSTIWLEALEPSQICEIDMTRDFAALRDDPGFMRVMFEVVHKRLKATTRHLSTLGRLDSTERVTLFLAETAAHSPGKGPVHLPMSRDNIADYLGLNAETVSRVFSKLRKQGRFRFLSPTEYVVDDMEAVVRSLPVPIGAKPARRPSAAPPPSPALPAAPGGPSLRQTGDRR